MKNKKIIYWNIAFFIMTTFLLSIASNNTFQQTDYDFPLKYRLNNGNYLVIAAKGIYLFDPSFNLNKTIIKFNYRQFGPENYNISNIAQFSSDDNGYIICLVNNITYFLSKEGNLLTNYSLNYIERSSSYSIIPYGHKNYNYYYTIIFSAYDKIYFINYAYNSIANNISLISSESRYIKDYNSYIDYMSCELMKNSGNQYITCFCGDMPEMYLFVFNATDYTLIHKLQKNVSDSYWGFGETIFSSNIMTKECSSKLCYV